LTSERYDLVTFGETMIRLTTTGGNRLETTGTLAVTIGGAESNVCVALARLGRRVSWLSALPDNPLGQRIFNELRGHGVDTSQVLWSDTHRAGVYFMETGARPRPTRVTYDRAGSVVAMLEADAIDTGLVVNARALHLTGITPALSENCAAICQRLAGAAVAAGVPLILDVNYRSLLWTPEEAARGLDDLCQQATVLLCGANDAQTVWGLSGQPSDVSRGLLDRSGAELAVVTLGESGVCAINRAGDVFEQASLAVDIVDPVGAGDAFAAGFLHAWLEDRDNIPSALRSGVALAALSMTIPGDLAIITPADLAAALDLLEGGGTDIVR
jgi:2-dehydro-3-deoxygluconokinase